MFKKGATFLRKVQNNHLFVQSLKTMGLRIFGILVLFGFTFFLTRTYPPEIIGQYDFIRTFLLVLGSIAILGTDQSILYFSGILRHDRNLGEMRRIYYKMLRIILIVSAIILLSFLLLGPHSIGRFLNDSTVYPIMLKSVGLLFFYAVTLFNTEVFRALERVYLAELFRNTFKYLSIILGAVLLLQIGRPEYLIDSFLSGFVILAIVSTILIKRYFALHIIVDQKIDVDYKAILKKSFPIAVSTMAIFLLTTIDIILLKKFYGDKTVAQYGVAVKFMTIVSMVIQMVNINSSTKIATQYFAQEFKILQKVIKNSARMIVAFVIPVIFVTVVFSREILEVFGAEYVVANRAMKIMIIGQGITALFGVAPVYLNMTGRQNYFQAVLIFGVVLNLFLNYFLIPIYGMEGAAVSYIASMFCWNAAVAVKAYKSDKVKIFFH